MTKKPVRHGSPVAEIADGMPTLERTNHGLVERLERAISDASGRPARPYRFVDTLAVMERRGSITAGMRQAGEGFGDCFASRNLTPLAPLTYRARGAAVEEVSDLWKSPGHEPRMRGTWFGVPPLPSAASAQPAVHVYGTWWDGNNL